MLCCSGPCIKILTKRFEYAIDRYAYKAYICILYIYIYSLWGTLYIIQYGGGAWRVGIQMWFSGWRVNGHCSLEVLGKYANVTKTMWTAAGLRTYYITYYYYYYYYFVPRVCAEAFSRRRTSISKPYYIIIITTWRRKNAWAEWQDFRVIRCKYSSL